MTFISTTRLHLRSKLRFLPFVFHTWRSARQARRSAGFLGGLLGGDAQGGAWTITVWDSETDMRAFRNSGAHLIAMPKLLALCDEASFTHWTAEMRTVPTMEEAYEHMKTSGRSSKVGQPSAAHLAGRRVSESVPRAELTLRARRKSTRNARSL
ncbi:MAG TPA: hypothetical protein VKV79_00135 [Terriglobia bacterium]|nr:hypothetical protein [Terriglobia bacterium]